MLGRERLAVHLVAEQGLRVEGARACRGRHSTAARGRQADVVVEVARRLGPRRRRGPTARPGRSTRRGRPGGPPPSGRRCSTLRCTSTRSSARTGGAPGSRRGRQPPVAAERTTRDVEPPGRGVESAGEHPDHPVDPGASRPARGEVGGEPRGVERRPGEPLVEFEAAAERPGDAGRIGAARQPAPGAVHRPGSRPRPSRTRAGSPGGAAGRPPRRRAPRRGRFDPGFIVRSVHNWAPRRGSARPRSPWTGSCSTPPG